MKMPAAITDDMVIGYAKKFLYEARVTWMEMTVSSAFWTSLCLFTVAGIRKHIMHERIFNCDERVGFRGNVFSAPMDWKEILQQIDALDASEPRVALPHTGAVLASSVQVHVSGGLLQVSRYMKEATVRRYVVIRLILMKKESGHRDYQHLDTDVVRERAEALTRRGDGTLP